MHRWTDEQLRIIRLAAVEANMILHHISTEYEDLGIRVKAPAQFDVEAAWETMARFAERVVVARAGEETATVMAAMVVEAARVAGAYGVNPPLSRNGIQVDRDWFEYRS